MSPLTWPMLVTRWDVPIPAAILWTVTAAGYLIAAIRHPGWPVARTIVFLAGVALGVFATGGAIDVYSGVLFTVHMAQHLLLIMVVPALLLLGRPFELFRLPRALRGPAAVGTHPLAAFVIYAVVVTGTHLTPFLQGALTVGVVHAAEELLYLGAGLLLVTPILGLRSTPYLLRLVVLFAAMVVDAVVGVALMMTAREPFPAYAAVVRNWGPGLAEDLHWGGAAMWIGGDALMAALAIFVISRWMSATDREDDLGAWLESARRSALDLGDNTRIDDDEEALRAYNAMLARLARDERR